MNFEQYLKEQLSKPVNNEFYCADGNSDRAVVVRGFFRETIWQYKRYPEKLLGEIKDFDGWSTEIGWFVLVPVLIILAPVIPIIWAKLSTNRAIEHYKMKFKKDIK